MWPPSWAMMLWTMDRVASISPLGLPMAAEATALPWEPYPPAHIAPSIRLKAISRPPESHTATLILIFIDSAFAIAPCAILLASASVRATGTTSLQYVIESADCLGVLILPQPPGDGNRSRAG